MNPVIESLQARNSVKLVKAPGPSEQEFTQIMQTAMRAPDHGRLRPWRFKRILPEQVDQLMDLAIKAMADEGNPYTDAKIATTRRWLDQAPVIMAVACYIDHSNERIPHQERVLATGAAVMNILNASNALGYAAYWSTGLGTYTQAVPEALGFDDLEYQFMGFVTIGTPIAEVRPKERPDYTEFYSEWSPET